VDVTADGTGGGRQYSRNGLRETVLRNGFDFGRIWDKLIRLDDFLG
jgi:hypothetical protein